MEIKSLAAMTQEAIDEAKRVIQAYNKGEVWAKTIDLSTGLFGVNLEQPSKKLYPVRTFFTKRIARKPAEESGKQVEWKAITGINTGGIKASVAEGARNSVVSITTASKTAAYKSFGLDDKITFEAITDGKGFEDIEAGADIRLLAMVMEEEEKLLFGGNAGLALGTTGTPTATAATDTGSVASGTYNVICVALTLYGYLRATKTGTLSLVDADHAKQSAAQSVTLSATGRIHGNVANIDGAVAYAWYIGASGSERLQQITTINSYNQTAALSTSNQLLSALTNADKSTDANDFDGIITQLFTSGSGITKEVMATGTNGTGTGLSGDGIGGIVEFDKVLKGLWDDDLADPELMVMSSQEAQNLVKKVLAGGANTFTRVVVDLEDAVRGGQPVPKYYNKFTDRTIVGKVHPFCPPGHIFFLSESVPYPNSEVPNAWEVDVRLPYTRYDFAVTTREKPFGIYGRQVLKGYFTTGCGVVKNIADS